MNCFNYRLIGLCLFSLSLLACHSQPQTAQGNSLNRAEMLCPSTPNCVSSDAAREDADHWTPPLELAMPADQAWPLIVAELESMPRTQIISRTQNEVHAEVKSAMFGFVDDVVLSLDGNQLMLYSASRLGYSDLGVNRRRVNLLAEQLQQKSIVR
jgi:uncharacterized protein (DUF1499 family)